MKLTDEIDKASLKEESISADTSTRTIVEGNRNEHRYLKAVIADKAGIEKYYSAKSFFGVGVERTFPSTTNC